MAHPHNWIGLHSRFTLDEQARLIQLTQRWEFDMYYSMMTHADLLNEYGNEETGLQETAKQMVRNLASVDYFSELRIDEFGIQLPMPTQYALRHKKKEGQSTLELEMTFHLEPDLNVENKTLTLRVFDPTYYIAMQHMDESSIEVTGGNATECSRELKLPSPSDELLEYAGSLDRSQTNTDGLGSQFAEIVTINCF